MTDETGERAQQELRLKALERQVSDLYASSAAVQELVDWAFEITAEGISEEKRQELEPKGAELKEHPEVKRWMDLRTAISDARRRLNIRVVK